jgi:hypothetical protein
VVTMILELACLRPVLARTAPLYAASRSARTPLTFATRTDFARPKNFRILI